jgi:hypothetical protein
MVANSSSTAHLTNSRSRSSWGVLINSRMDIFAPFSFAAMACFRAVRHRLAIASTNTIDSVRKATAKDVGYEHSSSSSAKAMSVRRAYGNAERRQERLGFFFLFSTAVELGRQLVKTYVNSFPSSSLSILTDFGTGRHCFTIANVPGQELIELQTEIGAWSDKTNAKQRGVDWQFRIEKARVKLKRL